MNINDYKPSDPTLADYAFAHTLIEGHTPQENEIKFSIGHYKIIELIGKGGMGEVFLAYDTQLGRRIALKRIRPDLLDHKQINNRFLKEAHVTSQLTHPSIIPIYSIHKEVNQVYYTMPFVQGETLKQILKKVRKQVKKGKKPDQYGGSIPSLVRIFINVCQAVAYAHSKKVLHRDLKPENIIVGPYGEVLILDWGLAKLIRDNPNPKKEQEEELQPPSVQISGSHLSGITRIGKVVGTVSYMAPERAKSEPSTFLTDIYSLGVILYQMLTLKYPFIRPSLEEFRKKMDNELIHDPIEIAPYRDIPQILSKITMRCLEVNPANRYQTIDELIKEIASYIEGKADWFHIASLDPLNKTHWEFQEHIYFQDHAAITHSEEVCDWMSLMISKDSFSENIKLEARIKLKEGGHGLGFLFSIPESSERHHLNDGYCLWIGTESYRSTKLMRSMMEVMYAPEIFLRFDEWYNIRIDKVDNIIHFYLNNKLQFSYISHLPLVGTHVGLISRDFNYTLEDFNIFVGGQNVLVKCLAVPDAFLANKLYSIALSEYRRIGYAFKGRDEGREALFRAGITLLEEAKSYRDKTEANVYFNRALEEFEKLYKTPGAPLEYLGKALVYQALKEYDEEIKCFELASRRYPKHPLLPILHEQIIYRTHECSRIHRKATYQFILLAVKLFNEITISRHIKKIFESLQKHWEELPFIIEPEDVTQNSLIKNQLFSIKLAFWLGTPLLLEEIITEMLQKDSTPFILIFDALTAIIKLGSYRLAQKILSTIKRNEFSESLTNKILIRDLKFMIECESTLTTELIKNYFDNLETVELSSEIAILHALQLALNNKEFSFMDLIASEPCVKKFSEEKKLPLDATLCWGYLLQQRWEEASSILFNYPIEALTQETSILHTLYGCWLLVNEGKEIAQIHFSGVLETSFPRTWCLLGHFLTKRFQDNHVWMQRSFSWEKRELYRQLELYYHLLENKDLEEKYRILEIQEHIDVI